MSRSALAHQSCPPIDVPTFVQHADLACVATRRNYLIGLRTAGPRPTVAFVPLDGDHPLDDLVGLRVPQSWAMVGVHCLGWAVRPGEGVDPGAAGWSARPADGERPPFDVRVTIVVDRHGDGAGLLREGVVTTELPGVPGGLLGDTCLRSIGLPTPSPPASTAELWLRVWLDRIVESVASDDSGRSSPCTFADLVALHPAVLGPTSVLRPDARLDTFLPEDVAETTLLLASEWPWSRLRASPTAVETDGPPVNPTAAAWMDDGMFARWLLADVPPVGLLRKTAAQLLPLPLLDGIERTMARCGVLLPHRPP